MGDLSRKALQTFLERELLESLGERKGGVLRGPFEIITKITSRKWGTKNEIKKKMGEQ